MRATGRLSLRTRSVLAIVLCGAFAGGAASAHPAVEETGRGLDLAVSVEAPAASSAAVAVRYMKKPHDPAIFAVEGSSHRQLTYAQWVAAGSPAPQAKPTAPRARDRA